MHDITIWIGFNLFVLLMLWVDLSVFHKESHAVGYKEALTWSAVWIGLALLFCLGIFFFQGKDPALKFLAGYLIEKSLSVDNLFVFLMIFSYFSVPQKLLHKVLYWGVLGALIMRAIFIFGGIVLIEKFHWLIYLFGVLLVYAGIKLGISKEKYVEPEKNIFVQALKRFLPITHEYHGDRFFVKINGKVWATPLLLVLVTIETTDIIFAIDSVPAILAITNDPFIVYTSNVFAILGLRALYFALSKLMTAFYYLNYGLACLLIFIGFKMIFSDVISIPISITLLVIALILTIAISASILFPKKQK